MYVRPAARGRGVARALLARLERETLAVGITLLQLETGIRHTAAVQLYESAGFAHCAAAGAYASMPPAAIATSIFYQKQLGPTSSDSCARTS